MYTLIKGLSTLPLLSITTPDSAWEAGFAVGTGNSQEHSFFFDLLYLPIEYSVEFENGRRDGKAVAKTKGFFGDLEPRVVMSV